MLLDAETNSIVNSDKERKEERSEDSSIGRLRTEADSIINNESLEQIKDVNECGAPPRTESHSLIDPDSFKYSNARKEKKSEDASMPSE